MLERYGHGGDLVTAADEYGLSEDGFLDFSSNMNPYGPPESVGRLLCGRWRELARYPDPAIRSFRRKLAERFRIDAERIWVGNGAAELIDLAVRAIMPRTAAVVRPSFSEYEEAVTKAGGRVIEIPLSAADRFDLPERDVRRVAARTDVLIVGHPNNPTGRPADPRFLRDLARDGVRLIVDEAFIDFSPEQERLSLIRLAAESDRVAVIRSMTKFYAVPGIRLGFVVAGGEWIARIRRLQVPWSVNAPAQWIGEALLDEREYAERTVRWIGEERAWLSGKLASLGLTVTPSEANFLLCRLPSANGGSIGPLDAGTVQRLLGRRGVLIRDASRFPGLDGSYIRVAVRLRHENERLVSELARVFARAADGRPE